MLALAFIGGALIPVVAIGWVFAWLIADAVGGTARPALAPVRVRNRH